MNIIEFFKEKWWIGIAVLIISLFVIAIYPFHHVVNITVRESNCTFLFTEFEVVRCDSVHEALACDRMQKCKIKRIDEDVCLIGVEIRKGRMIVYDNWDIADFYNVFKWRPRESGEYVVTLTSYDKGMWASYEKWTVKIEDKTITILERESKVNIEWWSK